jgi:hypothetical protein
MIVLIPIERIASLSMKMCFYARLDFMTIMVPG